MDPAQNEEIYESLLKIERLQRMIQENKEDINLCLRSEMTDEYCIAMDYASELLQTMKIQLINIQSL